jgi:hypothetical protein
MNKSELLYNTLLNDRENLIPVFEQMNDYFELKEIIKQLESEKKELDVLYKLCNGHIGNKYKSSAIYELPTRQLIESIAMLFQIFNIRNIDDVGCGMGLLSALLKKQFDKDNYNVELIASDNGSSDSTNIPLSFYPIHKKDIYDIVIQHENNLEPPDGIICTWPINKMENNFNELIKNRYIKMFIFIDDIKYTNILSDRFVKLVEENKYTIIKLPIYQICFLDYFSNNIIECRSTSTIIVKNELLNEFINFYEILSPNLYKYSNYDELNIDFNDMAIIGKIPFWIAQLQLTNEKNIITSIISYLDIINHKFIPLWIPNMELLIFWFIQFIKKMFPSHINNVEMLYQYYNRTITRVNTS